MSKTLLRSTTALVLVSLLPVQAVAQEEDGFLGTLFLTFGKRDLQVGTPVTSTVVDDAEIADRQAGTIAQLIDTVPGVSLVNGSTPQGSGINIRGWGANTTFGNDQKIAVVVDGARVGSEELYRMGTQLFTDPLLYREVEVFRGTIGSFEYGSGIVGGVVRLETKDASDFTNGEVGFRFAQTLEGTSNGNGVASSSILAWQPTERAEFLANYTIRRGDDLENGDGDEIGNSSVDMPSWLAKGKFTFGQDNDQSLTLSVTSSVNDESDVPQNEFASVSDLFGRVDRVRDTQQASLRYNWNPAGNDLIDLSVDLTYSEEDIEQDYIEGSSPFENDPGFGGQIRALANADHNYTETALNVKNRSLFTTGAIDHNLLVGTEVRLRERAENELNNAASAFGGTDRRFAVYAINEMTTGPWTIMPALRYEQSNIESDTFGDFDNDAWMGGLALAYELNNGVSIFGSYAYTEGLPPIDDVSSLVRANLNEKSETYEIGVGYGGDGVFAAGDNFSIRANLYHTTTWDITSYTVPGSVIDNLDNVETNGLELEASYGLEDGFYLDLNANIADGREVYPGGDDAVWRNTPADTARLTVGKRWGEQLDLSWELLVAGDAEDNTGETFDGYNVSNIRATYVPQSGAFADFEVRVGVENVFDTNYRPYLSSKDQPGRNFKLTLTKVF
ncbi:TonB-dependent receptor domain-containing protein [Marivita sp. S0852]|uniref:TonB-dependent receptor domain-containing protein n=1 Tax=Marivita sp. S0852 TaxID=3373893 RepID=UPI003981E33D